MKRISRGTATISQLTKREFEVLQLVVKGMDNQEIAQSLALSEQTVRNYVSHVYAKLEVKNRVQAVLRAINLGVTPTPD